MSHQHSSTEPNDHLRRPAGHEPPPTPGDLRHSRRRTAITVATIIWWTVIGITLLVLSREAAAENTPLDLQHGDLVFIDDAAASMYVFTTMVGAAYVALGTFTAVRQTATRQCHTGDSSTPGMIWLRGCCTTLAPVMVLFTFPEGSRSMLAVALVLVDWHFAGHRRNRIRWWHPLTWTAVSFLVFHVTYTLYVHHLGFDVGPLLWDEDAWAVHLLVMLVLLSLWLLSAYLVYAIAALPRYARCRPAPQSG